MPERAELPSHVTMPLLDVVTRSALDEDYQHVAEKRAAAGERAAELRLRWPAVVVVGLFGLLLVVAAVQQEAEADTEALAREQLVTRIDSRRDQLLAANATVQELGRQITVLTRREERLAREERELAAANLALGGTTGFAPVSGPGVRVQLDDNPDGSSDGVVRDEDLATLVDGLWAAGAEAISVNGHRLTQITGIRTAGSAILVQDRPLRPPYVVLAVGDVDTLQSRFVESGSGTRFLGLRGNFGFSFKMQNQTTLKLPAAPDPSLLRAVPVNPEKEVAP